MSSVESRLDLYLTAARAEACATLDVGPSYGRVIARSDVAPNKILQVCRHQVDTAMLVLSLSAFDDGSTPITVTRWVHHACKDAALVVGSGYRWNDLGSAIDYKVSLLSDDNERDVYRAWFRAHACYLDEEGTALAKISYLSRAEAVATVHRYGSIAMARSATDYHSQCGEWLPTPDEVAQATIGSVSTLATRYPSAYGTYKTITDEKAKS